MSNLTITFSWLSTTMSTTQSLNHRRTNKWRYRLYPSLMVTMTMNKSFSSVLAFRNRCHPFRIQGKNRYLLETVGSIHNGFTTETGSTTTLSPLLPITSTEEVSVVVVVVLIIIFFVAVWWRGRRWRRRRRRRRWRWRWHHKRTKQQRWRRRCWSWTRVIVLRFWFHPTVWSYFQNVSWPWRPRGRRRRFWV